MSELSAFWVGASRADLGQALHRFLAARKNHLVDWREALAGVSIDEVVAHPDTQVTQAQARVWRAATAESSPFQALIRGQPGYPPRLARLDDAPPVLFVEGEIAALHSAVSVGVVGARECSPYAAGAARDISARLAAAGVVVISGLARGIDASAHRGALAGGRTVAVLGHGLSFTSPPSNRQLRREIVANGGAMISSWPDGTPPEKWTFPRRNRWIAALSDAVVVAQAGEHSGALITAYQAADLSKPVYVVPGRLGDAMEGGLRLAQEGANLVWSIDDLVAALSRQDRIAQRCAWLERLFLGASLDDVAKLRGVSISALLRDLAQLEAGGEVARRTGGLYVPGPANRLVPALASPTG